MNLEEIMTQENIDKYLLNEKGLLYTVAILRFIKGYSQPKVANMLCINRARVARAEKMSLYKVRKALE